MLSHAYTKRRLLKELAYKAGIRQELSQKILDALVEIAYREAGNEGFVLPGLCKFEVVDRKARKIRNPRTGETLIMPPHKALKATLSALAKRTVAPKPRAVPAAEYTPPEPPPKPVAAAEAKAENPVPPVVPVVETPAPQPPPATAEAEAPAEKTPEPPAAEQEAAPAVEQEAAPVAEQEAAPAVEESVPEAIYFRCPQCDQEIEAPGSAAGAEAECPLCGAIVRVPEKNEDGTCGSSEVISVNEAAKMEPEALKHMTIRINAAELGLDDAANPAAPVQMISFFCEACHQEIEASPDMAGTQSECPNCGSPISIPMFSQAPTGTQEQDPDIVQAMKNRTMRIDLNNF